MWRTSSALLAAFVGAGAVAAGLWHHRRRQKRWRRTLVVGDVHGCAQELRLLLEKCEFDPAQDRLIFVVGKGPDSVSVVRLARETAALCVIGNHDRVILRWREHVRRGGDPATLKMSPTHRQAAEGLTEADWRYLEAQPLWLRVPEPSEPAGEFLVVHAGLVPGKPLAAHSEAELTLTRNVRPDGGAADSHREGTAWARLWRGPLRVFFGHDAVRGLQLYPRAVGLDTGCCYGGELTGYLFPDRRLVSVPARRVYEPPGKPLNPQFMSAAAPLAKAAAAPAPLVPAALDTPAAVVAAAEEAETPVPPDPVA